MCHRLLVGLVPFRPFLVVFAWKVTAFAAIVYLPFFAADPEINAAAAAFPKAILCYIPTAFAQRCFFHHRLGAFVFSYPSHTPEPRGHRFSRFQVLFHGDFVLPTFAAVNAAGR